MKIIKQTRSLLVLLPGLLFCQLLSADITASYAVKDGNTMTVSYRDDNHVRMDVTKDSYLLVSGGKSWMMTRDGGSWQAMDMSAIGKMMQGMPMPGMQQARQQMSESGDSTFRNTGRTETVAGYKGQVYEITDTQTGASREIVLSNHQDVVEASQAWMALSGNMMSNLGMTEVAASMKQAIEKGSINGFGGFLRQGDDMKLTSLSTKQKPDSFFQLPAGAKVQDMGGAMNGMGSGGQSGMDPRKMQQLLQQQQSHQPSHQQQEEQDAGSAVEEALKDQARDEGKRQVKEGVKNLIKGLF